MHNGNECEQLCDSAAEYVARLIDEPTSAAELEPDTCALSSTAFSFSMPLASGKLRALWDALDGGSKHDQHYAVRLDAKHTERERGGSLRSAWPDSFDSDCSTADLSTDELRLWTSTSGTLLPPLSFPVAHTRVGIGSLFSRLVKMSIV